MVVSKSNLIFFVLTIYYTIITDVNTQVCQPFQELPRIYSQCRQPYWDEKGTLVAGLPKKSGQRYGIPGSTNSSLFFPRGIFIDQKNNDDLYVVDEYNHRVLKFRLNSTVGITVAGGNDAGSANNQLNLPQDVFVDSNGALYITDSGNHRIMKWLRNSTEGEIISDRNSSYYRDYRGIYVNEKGDVLTTGTIGDQYGVMKYTVSRIVPSNSSTSVFKYTVSVLTTGLQLYQGIFIDQCGEAIYFVDSSDKTIQKIQQKPYSVTGRSDSIVTSLSDPQDIIMDQYGNLYTIGMDSGVIQRVVARSGLTQTLANATKMALLSESMALEKPVSLAMDSKNSLYVSDRSNHRIVKFRFSSGDLSCS